MQPASSDTPAAAASSRSDSGLLRIALFAGLAERAGSQRLELAWRGGSVAELRAAVAAACPAVADLLARSAIAVDNRIAADAEFVPPDADVAILPPVSGG